MQEWQDGSGPVRHILSTPHNFFYINFLDPVQGHHVKFPDRSVILRRVTCCHNHPAFRQLLVSKSLTLQKLQHCWRQCFGYTIDLINEQDPLPKAGLLHFIVHRSNDLAHGILCDRNLPALVLFLPDKRQPYRTLSGVMGDRIRDQTDPALSGRLLHDLCFPDPRRPHQQDGTLADMGHHIITCRILFQIGFNGVLDLLFRPFNMHNLLPPVSVSSPRREPGYPHNLLS